MNRNWQVKLANHTALPIFQDTNVGWIWDEFGGLEVIICMCVMYH
jgi:hypothetical protein